MMLNHLKFTLVFAQVKQSTSVLCVVKHLMMKLPVVTIQKNCTGKLVCKNCEMKFGHWKMLLEHYKKYHVILFVTYVLDYLT